MGLRTELYSHPRAHLRSRTDIWQGRGRGWKKKISPRPHLAQREISLSRPLHLLF